MTEKLVVIPEDKAISYLDELWPLRKKFFSEYPYLQDNTDQINIELTKKFLSMPGVLLILAFDNKKIAIQFDDKLGFRREEPESVSSVFGAEWGRPGLHPAAFQPRTDPDLRCRPDRQFRPWRAFQRGGDGGRVARGQRRDVVGPGHP